MRFNSLTDVRFESKIEAVKLFFLTRAEKGAQEFLSNARDKEAALTDMLKLCIDDIEPPKSRTVEAARDKFLEGHKLDFGPTQPRPMPPARC